MEQKSQIDNLIDKIFSKSTLNMLFLIVVLGMILRFIVASNVSALADEMVHGPHAIGFLHSGLISTIVESPLWFYLTDLGFKLLGVTLFSTRFLSFFYGTLSILLVFLIARKVFSTRIALLSAFFLAISHFTIRYTLVEMDLASIFFILFAILFFIESIEKKKFPYLAAICIGLAALIKTPALFSVPAFVLGFFFYSNDNKIVKAKKVVYFGLIILLIYSPIIIHNYLWYADKGQLDIYFAQYFNIEKTREPYQGLLGYNTGVMFPRFFEGLRNVIPKIFLADPLIIALGLLGFFYAFKEKTKYWKFFASFQIFMFVLLILSSWLDTHYLPLIPLICIFAGFFIDKIILKTDWKKISTFVLIAILIFQLYMLLPNLTSKSGLSQMREYAVNHMDKSSIVIADARIYRGRIAWLFNDFHYLESSLLPSLIEYNSNLTGQDYDMKVYFVECARDDCGWGTVTPEFNDSVESLVSQILPIAQLDKTINGGGGYEDATGQPYFRVYSTSLKLKAQAISLVDSTHDWFYYPINYKPKEKIFDNYSVNGFFNKLLYDFAWLIIILSIILAIVLPVYLIIKVIKDSKDGNISNNSVL